MSLAYYLGTKTASYKSALDEADYGGAAVGLGSGFGLHSLLDNATHGVDDKLNRAGNALGKSTSQLRAAQNIYKSPAPTYDRFDAGILGRSKADIPGSNGLRGFPGLRSDVTKARQTGWMGNDGYAKLKQIMGKRWDTFGSRTSKLLGMTDRLATLALLRKIKNPLAAGVGLGAGALATMGLRGAE